MFHMQERQLSLSSLFKKPSIMLLGLGFFCCFFFCQLLLFFKENKA